MKRVIALSYGEIALKKDNRSHFVTILKRNIKSALSGIDYSIRQDQSILYISTDEYKEAIDRLKKVFGVSYVSLEIEVEPSMDSINEAAIEAMDYELEKGSFKTFKVETKRADKSFPLKSPEISRMVGAHILKHYKVLEVDVKNPDRIIRVDIRKFAYITCDRMKGMGGMPVGSNGRVLSMLSGGIDSPVASILVMKRGLSCDFVHFHSYPFTSGRSFDKTLDLAKLASVYQPHAMLFSMNLLKIQEEIGKKCDIRFTTLLQRRSMIRLATRLCKELDRQAIVTGENLGQVASQTLEGMSVVDPVSDLMILRPLLCFDKTEIVDLAREFNTFETSILPYEDCCTVFVAKHPKTNPSLEQVLNEESKYDYKTLEEEIYSKMERHGVK
ncbi:MAG: tRNA 4-thiouridine(8) synthase ThiI [Firmicutes bacterium]|nr:tRNA 4-thiouridine(8) synthase ThiI [Bacillota bacterium]